MDAHFWWDFIQFLVRLKVVSEPKPSMHGEQGMEIVSSFTAPAKTFNASVITVKGLSDKTAPEFRRPAAG